MKPCTLLLWVVLFLPESVRLSASQSVRLSVRLSVRHTVCLPASLSVCLSVFPCACLSVLSCPVLPVCLPRRMQHVEVDGAKYIFGVQTNLEGYMPKLLEKRWVFVLIRAGIKTVR